MQHAILRPQEGFVDLWSTESDMCEASVLSPGGLQSHKVRMCIKSVNNVISQHEEKKPTRSGHGEHFRGSMKNGWVSAPKQKLSHLIKRAAEQEPTSCSFLMASKYWDLRYDSTSMSTRCWVSFSISCSRESTVAISKKKSAGLVCSETTYTQEGDKGKLDDDVMMMMMMMMIVTPTHRWLAMPCHK